MTASRPDGTQRNVAVLGATGFIGRAVTDALTSRGIAAVPLRAPRLRGAGLQTPSAATMRHAATELADSLRDVSVVINAAGIADSSSSSADILFPANAILPGVIGEAAALAGVTRYIHISSAAVQGRVRRLDDTLDHAPINLYGESKAEGELAALRCGPTGTVIYRPAGVHSRTRNVTRRIAAYARSQYSTVARPPGSNTPQALVGNVADALVFLALSPGPIPSVVAHPSEGLSTSELLTMLGGHTPHLLPTHLGHTIVSAAYTAAAARPSLKAQARRLEMMLFGQQQSESWLTHMGWQRPETKDGWIRLGQTLRPGLGNAASINRERS